MKAIPVKFSPHFDVYFSDEICLTGSGVSPNAPGTVALVNAEVDMSKITPEIQEACRKAWEKGHLEQFVRANFFPVGRAENARFWSDGEEDEI